MQYSSPGNPLTMPHDGSTCIVGSGGIDGSAVPVGIAVEVGSTDAVGTAVPVVLVGLPGGSVPSSSPAPHPTKAHANPAAKHRVPIRKYMSTLHRPSRTAPLRAGDNDSKPDKRKGVEREARAARSL